MSRARFGENRAKTSAEFVGCVAGVTHRDGHAPAWRGRIADMATPSAGPIVVSVSELHEQLGSIRLCEPRAVDAIQQSLERHGQLTALEVFAESGVLQVYDGLKRLQAARRMQWEHLRVHRNELSVVEAKIRMAEMHEGRGLSELEEGWLVRSLVRDHGLSLGAIGERLGRHKSWVCRRQMLAEALEPKLQACVRLGLLAARAAVSLAALPRGNQSTASELVMQRGLTVRQTELVVAQLLQCGDQAQRDALLVRWQQQPMEAVDCAARSAPHKARSELDWMSADITTLQRSAARLEARLMGNALCACPEGAQQLMTEALRTLVPALHSLVRSIEQATRIDEVPRIA